MWDLNANLNQVNMYISLRALNELVSKTNQDHYMDLEMFNLSNCVEWHAYLYGNIKKN